MSDLEIRHTGKHEVRQAGAGDDVPESLFLVQSAEDRRVAEMPVTYTSSSETKGMPTGQSYVGPQEPPEENCRIGV